MCRQGFAHGFQTLEDDTEVFYQMSEFYAPEAARGFRWNDPAFSVEWPEPVRVISDRDRSYPDFAGTRPQRSHHERARVRKSSRRPAANVGAELYGLVTELYPICRSITGDGVRDTLRRIQQRLPLAIHEVPSGTQVFDWTVPREWNIRDAWIKNLNGDRVVDFQRSNLHVVSYSVPVRKRVPLAELRQHLHTLPEHPGLDPV